MESLHRQVLPFLLRRVKEDVLTDLPPKITQDLLCELSPLQERLYEDFSKTHLDSDLRECLENMSATETVSKKTHVFQALRWVIQSATWKHETNFSFPFSVICKTCATIPSSSSSQITLNTKTFWLTYKRATHLWTTSSTQRSFRLSNSCCSTAELERMTTCRWTSIGRWCSVNWKVCRPWELVLDIDWRLQ